MWSSCSLCWLLTSSDISTHMSKRLRRVSSSGGKDLSLRSQIFLRCLQFNSVSKPNFGLSSHHHYRHRHRKPNFGHLFYHLLSAVVSLRRRSSIGQYQSGSNELASILNPKNSFYNCRSELAQFSSKEKLRILLSTIITSC